jgi:hypothetical protein
LEEDFKKRYGISLAPRPGAAATKDAKHDATHTQEATKPKA